MKCFFGNLGPCYLSLASDIDTVTQDPHRPRLRNPRRHASTHLPTYLPRLRHPTPTQPNPTHPPTHRGFAVRRQPNPSPARPSPIMVDVKCFVGNLCPCCLSSTSVVEGQYPTIGTNRGFATHPGTHPSIHPRTYLPTHPHTSN